MFESRSSGRSSEEQLLWDLLVGAVHPLQRAKALTTLVKFIMSLPAEERVKVAKALTPKKKTGAPKKKDETYSWPEEAATVHDIFDVRMSDEGSDG